MFDLRNSKPIQLSPQIRDTLFGDKRLTEWAAITSTSEPWSTFREAKQFIDSGDTRSATEALQRILEMPQLESRQYLQAWHFLRQQRVEPTHEKAKELLGVVVEVGMPESLDLVATYADHHARYYNHSGAGVVWERPDNSLDAVMESLLQAGTQVVQAIGPWKGDRPAAPHDGVVRINLLTPSGLHFGEGPFDALANDKLGGPVVAAAFNLMQALMQLAKK